MTDCSPQEEQVFSRLPSPDDRRDDGGFILPLVMVALAILSLALWSAVSVFELATRSTGDLREDVEFEIAAAKLEARLSYLLVTEPLGPSGLRLGGYRISRDQVLGLAPLSEAQMSRALPNFLYFDGRDYEPPVFSDRERASLNGVSLQLQDRAGLVNLNAPDETALGRLLALSGIKDKDARRLAATLADYTDRDDLKRLDGAERQAYQSEELPPPRNGPMRNVNDAFNALGWNTVTGPQRVTIVENAYVGPSAAPKNVNTATSLTLRSWFGLSAAQAARVIEMRTSDPFRSLYEFTGRTGLAVAESELNNYTVPAATVRVRLKRPGPRCRVYEVWISQSEGADSRPLFIRSRSDKSCVGQTSATQDGENQPDGVPIPFPDSPGLFPPGDRGN